MWSDNKDELLLKITLDYKANKIQEMAFNASFPHVKESLHFLSFESFKVLIFSGLKRVCVPTKAKLRNPHIYVDKALVKGRTAKKWVRKVLLIHLQLS